MTASGIAGRNEIFLLETVVAGTTHCPGIEWVAQFMEVGWELAMLRDPANIHDGCAIALFAGDTRVGWIPRGDNPVLSRLMDAGKHLVCRVHGIEWVGGWLKVTVRVSMAE